MIYCAIELRAMTVTFRNPEFQNFHKSLHLPPPTTLIGLAGAAFGKSPKAAQDFFEEEAWQLGIFGTSEGYAIDLWKYRKFDDKDPSGIVQREILFDNHFIAVFGCEQEDKVMLLSHAFDDPVYALTLGSSDSLAKVVSSSIIRDTEEAMELSNCLVPGNVISSVIENMSSGDDFSIYSTSEPIAYDLPIKFQYESDYGIRRVIQRKTLSFVGEPMRLNYLITGVNYLDRFIPVFPISDSAISDKLRVKLEI